MIGARWVVGVVGALQLDVLKSRVEAEYRSRPISSRRRTKPRAGSRSTADTENSIAANRGDMSEDRDGAPVFLARNAWELGYVAERSPAIKFADIRERA